MASRLHRITPSDRVVGPSTAGLIREQAIASGSMWAGYARTEPGMVSGWHHHGEHDSAIYVLSGVLRMEFGADGSESLDAGPGDFVFVPAGEVHRESNPSEEVANLVVVRTGGTGASVVNVEGPAG